MSVLKSQRFHCFVCFLQDSLSEPVLQGSLSEPVLQDELLLRCDDLDDEDFNKTTRQKMVSFIIIIHLHIYIL